MRVSDIASLEVRSCRPDTNLAAIAHIMWEDDCGVVPVVNGENKVVGVVTDRDICMAAATRPGHVSQIRAQDLMTGKAYTCRLSDDAKTALRTMAQNNVRRLPVLDEKGVLSGMLSLTDVILASRDPKVAKLGDLLWTDVVPMIDAITRPRKMKDLPASERRQAVAARAS